ncbi:MAG: type II secretion system F family protein [Nanoarchaeota archaeon]|nr:type II secretion system F family protein [Nanoarchaeota archaeon]
MINIFEQFFVSVARAFPDLELKIRRAGIYDTPRAFIKKTMIMALYMSIAIEIIIFMLIAKKGMTWMLIILFPILIIILFSYFMHLPDVKIIKKEKEINKEIVFAGRFIIIEIGSGVSLYNTMISVADHYKHVGQYFKQILQKVDMGTSLEDALNEEVELIPSENLKRILWQIINSLKTGADMANSLQVVLEQISKEQFIEIQKYGRKLNPMAMFYMMIAVIVPSLGITMMVIIASFIDIEIGLVILFIIVGFLSFIQFMFLSVIKASRPAVEL